MRIGKPAALLWAALVTMASLIMPAWAEEASNRVLRTDLLLNMDIETLTPEETDAMMLAIRMLVEPIVPEPLDRRLDESTPHGREALVSQYRKQADLQLIQTILGHLVAEKAPVENGPSSLEQRAAFARQHFGGEEAAQWISELNTVHTTSSVWRVRALMQAHRLRQTLDAYKSVQRVETLLAKRLSTMLDNQ